MAAPNFDSLTDTRQVIPSTAQAEGKIEVIEFFMYTCPHCHTLEPAVDAWLQTVDKEKIHFTKIPVQFSGDDDVRLHYALESLGADMKIVNDTLFMLGTKPRTKFNAKLNKLEAKTGIPADDIEKAANSFSVKMKAKLAMTKFAQSGHGGVPALVIDGNKQITHKDIRPDLGEKHFFDVVDRLTQ
jgi:thiol:disulfide interchange protein DsbA